MSNSISPEVLQNWDLASRHEWLLTNGIGGYASSSISGANTRRYHGLLVAAAQPPLGRVVLLSKIEEEIKIEDQTYNLSANKYPSVIYPQGYKHLVSVSFEPVLTLLYALHEQSVLIQKQIWMNHGENAVMVQYKLINSPEPIRLSLMPFMAYKDYHSEQHRWDGFQGRITNNEGSTNGVTFLAYDGAIPLRMGVTPEQSFQFDPESGWFYNYEHEREEERGLDFTEDLYSPGKFVGSLSQGKTITFYATIEPGDLPDPAKSLKAEESRLKGLEAGFKLEKATGLADVVKTLARAADQFVIAKSKRVSRATIIAGYHWFTDWGRDTFISMSGLCLSTGRAAVAKDILEAYAGSVQNGLIPNRFTDNNIGAEFNTVDATLWYVYAAHEYALATGDWALLTSKLLPTFQEIRKAHADGTIYHIKADPKDGLLYAGESGVQLTWMDAKVGDWVVTPRIGKPVEIQALYYNALLILSEIFAKAGLESESKSAASDAQKLKKSFAAKFVAPSKLYLYDVIDCLGATPDDPTIRPNQILALSLHHPLIDPKSDLAKEILNTLESELYTEVGMRTLAPSDPAYQGTYGPGDQTRRDGSYHQGTVWPWLTGHFIAAHLKTYGDPIAARRLLEPLLSTLQTYGVGSINEIFDGNDPHEPNGCIAQAWSVAQVIRALEMIDKA